VEVDLNAPSNLSAPIAKGDRIGTAVVAVDGGPVAEVAVLASRGLAPAGGASVVARVDDALPGPRIVAWAAIVGAGAAIVIGIALALAGRRRSPGQQGRGEVPQ
jgi:hypothetical protein